MVTTTTPKGIVKVLPLPDLNKSKNEATPLPGSTAQNAKSTFSQVSITRKNWTIHTIPTESNTPIQSYGGKSLINIDTLYLKIEEGILPELLFPEDGIFELSEHYHLEVEPFGGKQYSRKAKVYYSGFEIGTLLWGARLPSLANTAKFEIENAQLYDTINVDLWPELIIGNVLSLIKSSILAVFRVDIAFDSPTIINFMEDARDRIITPVRQKSFAKHDMRIDPITGDVKGFSFGSRASGRFIRCYDKSRELSDKHANGEKDYIKQFWIDNNLIMGPVFPRVGRLEIELHRKFLMSIPDFHYIDLFNRAKLAKLAEIAMKGHGEEIESKKEKSGWFDWVRTDHSDSKLNRRPRITVIDFSQVQKDDYVRQRPEKGQSKRTEKIMIKRLILDASNANTEGERISFLNTAAKVCIRASLWSWLAFKSDDIRREISKRAKRYKYIVCEGMLNTCLAELISQVNESFRSLAVKESLGIEAGEIVEV